MSSETRVGRAVIELMRRWGDFLGLGRISISAVDKSDVEVPLDGKWSVRRLSARLPWIVFAAAFFFYAFCEIRGFTPAYAEVDPDAYLFLAKRIANGEPLLVKDDSIFLFQHHMWVETEPGTVTAKYPPGYPILMAAACRLGGDEAMFMVSPIMGGLTLAGCWLLFRLWLKPPWAALSLLTLALTSQFYFYCTYLLAHAASLCLTVWGMYFLWRWLEKPGFGWGAAAGFLLGAAVSVRPTDGLFILPLLFAAGTGLWRGRKAGRIPWLGTATMLAAWAVPVAILALYNYRMFGGPITTGYAFSGEQNGFSAEYFTEYFGMLMGGLCSQFLPLLFPLGLLGMMIWGSPAERTLRLLWFLPIFVVYGSYYWVNPNWSYLRFFMSTLPVCIASAFFTLERISMPRYARTGSITVLLILFLSLNISGLLGAVCGEPIGHNPKTLADAARRLAKTLPSDAVIFSQEPWCYSIGPRQNWTLYQLEAFDKRNSVHRFSEPNRRWREMEPRRQKERTKRFREFYENSTDQSLLDALRETVRANIASGRKVFLFVPANQWKNERQRLGSGFEVKTVDEWDVKWDFWKNFQDMKWGIYEVTLAATK